MYTSEASFCKAALNKCKIAFQVFTRVTVTTPMDFLTCGLSIKTIEIKTFNYRLTPALPPDKTHWNIERQEDSTHFLVKLSKQVFI